MKNVLAVLVIAAGAIAALTLTGGATTDAAPPAARDETPTPRWEYRVVCTRAAPREAGARVAARPAAKGDPHVRFAALPTASAAEADALQDVERELNRLGGEGWDMCSAADGTMVFRRAR